MKPLLILAILSIVYINISNHNTRKRDENEFIRLKRKSSADE